MFVIIESLWSLIRSLGQLTCKHLNNFKNLQCIFKMAKNQYSADRSFYFFYFLFSKTFFLFGFQKPILLHKPNTQNQLWDHFLNDSDQKLFKSVDILVAKSFFLRKISLIVGAFCSKLEFLLVATKYSIFKYLLSIFLKNRIVNIHRQYFWKW